MTLPEVPVMLWALSLVLRRAEPAPRPPCGRGGCPEGTHGHYRPGSDCGRCGAVVCRAYVGRFGAAVRTAAQLLRLLAAR